MLNRIALGIGGLICAFAGARPIKLWWDTGKVWAYGGRYVSPHLVNYDLEPVYYDMRVWTYIIGVVVGLCMVWLAMGGKLPWIK